RHRLGGSHAEVDHVEQYLQRGLVLSVSARDADCHHWPALLQYERWREGDTRPLARLDAVGMARPGVETLETAAQPHTRVAGQGAAETTRRCGDHVALGVGDHARRCVLGRSAK